jgi:hypothetical protein
MTCFLTLFIKASEATGSIKSSNLRISALNLLKYALVNSPSCWATLKSSVEVFLVSILVLKCASLKLSIKFGSRPDCYTKHGQILWRLKGISCTLSHGLGWSTPSYSAYFTHALLGRPSHHSCPNSYSWKSGPLRVEFSICAWTREKTSTDGNYKHSLGYADSPGQTVSLLFVYWALGSLKGLA